MGSFVHKQTWVSIFIVYNLMACSIQGPKALDSVHEAHNRDNSVVYCAKNSVFPGIVQPFQDLATEACSHLRNYLEGTRIDGLLVEQVLDCDTPILSPVSKYGSAASIVTRVNIDGLPSHGSYLFIRFEQGWCPSDQLLEPTWNHGGYCETQFQLRWNPGRNDSFRELHVLSERICHMPLDQEEIAANESDIAMIECQHDRYLLNKNELTKISEFETEMPCHFQ